MDIKRWVGRFSSEVVLSFNLKLFGMKCFLPIFMLLATIVNGQNDYTSIHFRGLRPDDHIGSVPLHNPGRGFSLEVPVDLSAMKGNPFKVGMDATAYLKAEAIKYASDSLSLVQTCFYLPVNENSSIADSVLLGMQVYFDSLRSMGMKSMIRLDYRTVPVGNKGPKTADMLHHLDQLQQLLHRNKEVIMVVQAGMLDSRSGSTKNQPEMDDISKRTVLKKLLSMIPVPLQIQVRLPEYKNLIPVGDPDYERIGFYDDRFVIKPAKVDGGLLEGTPSYEQVVRESASTIVDGGLPGEAWTSGKNGSLVDGYKAALRFRLQHFSSFNLMRTSRGEGDGKESSMVNWKNVPVDPEQLKADKMPLF